MMQLHIATTSGRFWPCTECRAEPRLIEHRGRTRRETMQHNIAAVRHSLECRCGRSTGLHDSIERAEADWGKRFTQMHLALPMPAPARPRKVVSLRRRATEANHG